MAKKSADGPGSVLWQAANGWQRALREVLDPLDLTHAQFALLAAVASLEAAGPVRQEDAGGAAHTDPMTTSQVLRRMEAKGSIVRKPFPGDGRAVQVSTTAAGRRLVKKATPKAEAVDAAFFGALGSKQKATVAALRTLLG